MYKSVAIMISRILLVSLALTLTHTGECQQQAGDDHALDIAETLGLGLAQQLVLLGPGFDLSSEIDIDPAESSTTDFPHTNTSAPYYELLYIFQNIAVGLSQELLLVEPGFHLSSGIVIGPGSTPGSTPLFPQSTTPYYTTTKQQSTTPNPFTAECEGFHCADGTCIAASGKCDGNLDCPDESDEDVCEDIGCSGDAFHCANGRCISHTFVCDGFDDCQDNSDEVHCECNSEEFQCNDGSCVRTTSACDFMADCPDREDETPCGSCGPGQHPCIGYSNCYSEEEKCDGLLHCTQGDDELGCMSLRAVESGDGSAGYLQVKLAGVPYEQVCADDWSDDLSHQACLNMGFKGMLLQEESVSNGTGSYLVVENTIQGGSLLSRFIPGGCSSSNVVYLECSRSGCGRRPLFSSSPHTPYIINGDLAERGAWPWQVRMNIAGDFHCGGTLVNQHWILTAAHCVYLGVDLREYTEYVTVELGVTDSSDEFNPHLRRYSVDSIYTHPAWQPDSHTSTDGDIALLYVSDIMTLTDYVQPACLPDAADDLADYMECYITGWGVLRTSQLNPAAVLRQAKVTSLNESHCLEVMGEDLFNPQQELCLGSFTGSVGGCKGDSGGPFVCRDVTDTWHVIGVFSHVGEDCAFASIYKSVPYFRSWIDEQLLLHAP